jgi:hypothetical protein
VKTRLAIFVRISGLLAATLLAGCIGDQIVSPRPVYDAALHSLARVGLRSRGPESSPRSLVISFRQGQGRIVLLGHDLIEPRDLAAELEKVLPSGWSRPKIAEEPETIAMSEIALGTPFRDRVQASMDLTELAARFRKHGPVVLRVERATNAQISGAELAVHLETESYYAVTDQGPLLVELDYRMDPREVRQAILLLVAPVVLLILPLAIAAALGRREESARHPLYAAWAYPPTLLILGGALSSVDFSLREVYQAWWELPSLILTLPMIVAVAAFGGILIGHGVIEVQPGKARANLFLREMYRLRFFYIFALLIQIPIAVLASIAPPFFLLAFAVPLLLGAMQWKGPPQRDDELTQRFRQVLADFEREPRSVYVGDSDLVTVAPQHDGDIVLERRFLQKLSANDLKFLFALEALTRNDRGSIGRQVALALLIGGFTVFSQWATGLGLSWWWLVLIIPGALFLMVVVVIRVTGLFSTDDPDERDIRALAYTGDVAAATRVIRLLNDEEEVGEEDLLPSTAARIRALKGQM